MKTLYDSAHITVPVNILRVLKLFAFENHITIKEATTMIIRKGLEALDEEVGTDSPSLSFAFQGQDFTDGGIRKRISAKLITALRNAFGGPDIQRK